LGGMYDATGSPQAHQEGELFDLVHFFNGTNSSISLDKYYSWIMCNRHFAGYYITHYDDKNFEALNYVMRARSNAFSPGDRANLVHSAFTLAFQGAKSYRLAATIARNLATLETDYAPMSVLYWHLSSRLTTLAERRASFRELSAFALDLLKRRVAPRLDYFSDTGTHTERLTKADSLELSCRMLDSQCLTYANSKFRSIGDAYFASPDDRANLNSLIDTKYTINIYKII
jgi:hypothetical protein